MKIPWEFILLTTNCLRYLWWIPKEFTVGDNYQFVQCLGEFIAVEKWTKSTRLGEIREVACFLAKYCFR